MGNVLLSGKKMKSRQLSWINEYVISYKLNRTEMYPVCQTPNLVINAKRNKCLLLSELLRYGLKLRLLTMNNGWSFRHATI
jgi:hypothetical protein